MRRVLYSVLAVVVALIVGGGWYRSYLVSPSPGQGEVVPLEVMERHMIIKSLDQTEGNRTQAAQLLGISVRTLRNKLNEYRKLGIDVP